MNRLSRRRFLALTAASGTLIPGVLRGEAPQPAPAIPIPGLELGEPTKSFALRNVTVIDCTGKPAMPRMSVVIAGNRIQTIERANRSHLPAGVQQLDATGKFLIPGLWDMHSHPWPAAFPLFIPNGVIGTRIMRGGNPDLIRRRTETAQGKMLGPRLVVGSPILDGLADAKEAAILAKAELPPGGIVVTPDQGRLAVQTAVKEGAEFIKVYNDLTRDAYFAIVTEAKRLGVPVVGHLPRQLTLAECAEAGQKSFEHMAGVFRYVREATGIDRGGRGISVTSLTKAQATALYDIFRKNGASLCPTMTTIYGLGGDPALRDDSRLKYFDAETKARWAAVFKATDLADVRERYQHTLGLIGAMHKAGVNMLAGTDTARASGEPFCMPGFSLHDELRRFVDAGLTPLDALRTATYKPAEFFGVLKMLGTIERGKLAELVLLDANPLDNVANTTKINAVFTGGRMYRRPALDAMLSAVERNATQA